MSVSTFLELVEIKAKTASVMPFLLGLCFSAYYYHSINWGVSAVFFIAMFMFNMVVDMLDNYNDYYHADSQSYQQKTNIIGRENINPKLVRNLIISLTAVSAILGLWLVYTAGLAVLWLGIFCFLIGYLYSSGPHPISSLPLGELASGFTMGFMIALISVYLNAYQVFTWNWLSVGQVFLLALADELWISNLMLANNICDAQEDEDNHRKTIVHFIGKKAALTAFSIKNVLAFAVIILLPFLKLAPATVWLTVLIVPFVYKQNKLLLAKQVKTETFICAVKTLLIGSLTYVVTYMIGFLFK
ncbi:prenyltransferase [Lactobacillus kefiranofaciens]|uniref:Prenyltransferase n=1 Tax=Lactobacillus kefiranofaciens TaxID=267818 RepID=A0AAX3UGJ4_9LACO|nr:prenyltransferase [Lactobacillus kefiranofaciens]AEG39856.1 1,4-dihydroxy-2-naphthoate octaprenyltransferase [Lactobacillus kefiranofaciens subsp. kefiranofaciens]KRL23718.1 1,4-dihydroxy-2-naphthoate octaprenyltransferase [Lactobacillus kefiranofaciens subsp. kefirgranum DSM 10550 = JCM 8572]KRM20732.1 1,4-dihydroxy-2-naphthoate octaprenyltransferase [Lactobacillus kefiranofaciens subsp. kefiranofaciens DSM 5016 = JCM 6985]MCJ2172791.1 prenyltransferase [Lactobacillus kefiranofaciens]MCP93